MFSITNHYRNANQSPNKILPHNRQNSYNLKRQVLETLWEKGNPSALLEGVLLISHNKGHLAICDNIWMEVT